MTGSTVAYSRSALSALNSLQLIIVACQAVVTDGSKAFCNSGWQCTTFLNMSLCVITCKDQLQVSLAMQVILTMLCPEQSMHALG